MTAFQEALTEPDTCSNPFANIERGSVLRVTLNDGTSFEGGYLFVGRMHFVDQLGVASENGK